MSDPANIKIFHSYDEAKAFCQRHAINLECIREHRLSDDTPIYRIWLVNRYMIEAEFDGFEQMGKQD